MCTLDNLHIQEYGFHCLIANLNNSKAVDVLICEGTASHIFGPTNLKFTRPHFIIFTYRFLSLYSVSCFKGKISPTATLMYQHKPLIYQHKPLMYQHKPCIFQQQALLSFGAIFFHEFFKRFSKRVTLTTSDEK